MVIEIDVGCKGSILCFLFGWDEIKSAMVILEEIIDFEFYEKLNVILFYLMIF